MYMYMHMPITTCMQGEYVNGKGVQHRVTVSGGINSE